jgi:protein-disulfide isomerase
MGMFVCLHTVSAFRLLFITLGAFLMRFRKFNLAALSSSFLSTAALGLLVSIPTSAHAQVDPAFAGQMKQYLESVDGRAALVTAMKRAAQEEEVRAKEEALEASFKNREDVAVGASPVKGNAAAKITLIEFSDFECPYCSRGNQTAQQVLKAYPNDVKIVFKNLPLPFHNEAEPAAKAALAAGKQGKFWEFHDELFANQQKLGDAFYEETAKKLGLKVDQWKKDLASPEIAAAVKADKDEAERHEVRGTPGFFVNGIRVAGAYPFEHFKSIVDRLLAEK